ncbi:MAG: EscU/YscU/HrcU family type III secretion system export apparatus switch protein [Treponema sp.]|nr:EscU/YscU/HrcU family type III secretion system export apparatus switch protein [Treponema sp.]
MSQIDLQWFSAEDEGKTEQPSEYKLRKARDEEGRVPKSQELNGSIILLFIVFMLVIMGPWIERKLEEVMIFYFNNILASRIDDVRFAVVFLRYFLMLTLPFCIVGGIIGIVANIIQNKGFIYTTKLIMPKFDKLVPNIGKYLKRTMFSFEGAFNVVKSLLKVSIIAFSAYLIIRHNLKSLLEMIQTGGAALAMRFVGKVAAQILIVSTLFLVIIGVADYLVQKRQFIEEMKMTKQEVKEEFKEMEGDPEVKNRLEAAQREMLQQNMPKAVREADVLITNPTHFAVALQWQKEAPQVTAKGEDMTALNMRRIAKEADVPIVENRSLARGLYTDTKLGDIIPEAYYKVVSIVYAQIGYMEKKKRNS